MGILRLRAGVRARDGGLELDEGLELTRGVREGMVCMFGADKPWQGRVSCGRDGAGASSFLTRFEDDEAIERD